MMSLVNDDELVLHSLTEAAQDEIKDNIFPLWPHGVVKAEMDENDWRVNFNNAPWKSTTDLHKYDLQKYPLLAPHLSGIELSMWSLV
jgi:hypothetical protein